MNRTSDASIHPSIHILISAPPALRVTAVAAACLSCVRVKVGLVPGHAANSPQGRNGKQYLEYLNTHRERTQAAHRKGLGPRTHNSAAVRRKNPQLDHVSNCQSESPSLHRTRSQTCTGTNPDSSIFKHFTSKLTRLLNLSELPARETL